jgi:hypothetical protein
MKEEKLKELLERYYNGDTTSEEEYLLKEYFSGNNILPGYEAEKEIFRYYSADEKATAPSGNLESRILEAIDILEEKQKLKNAFFERNRLIILSVAASLLILIGSYYFFLYKTEPKDTYNDPQIAYAETKQILYDISVKLNRGTEALQHVARTAQTGLKSVVQSANLISSQIEIVENLDKILGNGNRTK